MLAKKLCQLHLKVLFLIQALLCLKFSSKYKLSRSFGSFKLLLEWIIGERVKLLTQMILMVPKTGETNDALVKLVKFFLGNFQCFERLILAQVPLKIIVFFGISLMSKILHNAPESNLMQYLSFLLFLSFFSLPYSSEPLSLHQSLPLLNFLSSLLLSSILFLFLLFLPFDLAK